MQGQILTMESDASLILGDDGARYGFTPQEWQGGDMKPEVGMRVDFEVRGSDAADIFPIPAARPSQASTPSAAPAAAPAQTPVAAPAQTPAPAPGQTPATAAADEKVKAMFGRAHDQLTTHYDPVREIIGNYGIIAVGITVLAVSFLMGFDPLAALLRILGMIVGVGVAAVGVYMLGKEEGWWDKSGRQAGGEPAPPRAPSGPHAEIERTVQTSSQTYSENIGVAGNAGAAGQMKTCPYCAKAIKYAAIRCRYCGADVSN